MFWLKKKIVKSAVEKNQNGPIKNIGATRDSSGPESLSNLVTFEIFNPAAKEVFVCGDFNGWSKNANPLMVDSTGRWKTSLNLSPGRYEYRFIVDGQWCNDQRPVYLVDNDFGSQNCLIEV